MESSKEWYKVQPLVLVKTYSQKTSNSRYDDEEYDAGYDDGEDDAVNGNGWMGQYDNSNRYKGEGQCDIRFPKLGMASIALSNVLLAMIFLWWRGLMTGLLMGFVSSSSSTFKSNVSIKREQNQTCLCCVECEKGRMKSKRKR